MRTAVKITDKARNSTFDKCKIYGGVKDSGKNSKFKKTIIGLKQYRIFNKKWKIILDIIFVIAAIVGILTRLGIGPFNFFQSKKTETAPIIIDSIFANNSPNSVNTINKLDIPEPNITMYPIDINQPREKNFQSKFTLEIDSKVPMNNFRLQDNAKNIVSIEAIPQSGGAYISGSEGITKDFAFINIPNAYGTYIVTVVTKEKTSLTFE